MRFQRRTKLIVVGVGVCLLLCAFALGLLRWSIQSSLDGLCATAQEAHPRPGDHVAALVAYVESPSHGLRQRNRAVWALGQACDERALPVLKRFFTGGKCDHDRRLCQHELAKAIKLCRGETPNLLCINVR